MDSIPIVVLISGGGTTLENLIEKRKAGLLNADIKLVISSNPDAGGLNIASQASIETRVAERKKIATAESFRDAIFDSCREVGAQLVVMGGFLKHVLIPDDFKHRVTNIHPSLIPSFCGKGFYGLRVHQAVLDYGARVTGCTVHFVDNQYDHGPILLQRIVPVQHNDTAETLARRVFEQECEAYPDALNFLAAGKVRVEGRRAVIL